MMTPDRTARASRPALSALRAALFCLALVPGLACDWQDAVDEVVPPVGDDSGSPGEGSDPGDPGEGDEGDGGGGDEGEAPDTPEEPADPDTPETPEDPEVPGDDPGTDPAPTTPVGCTGAQHTPGGPDRWGGCWPGPDNTGVPAGVELTPYDGPCTITKAGTVIDARTVNCPLTIQAADVVISRSLINGTVATDEGSTGFSFTITDSEVAVGNVTGTGVGAVNFVARRVHVHGGNRSMHCWRDCTIEDSYVHGQFEDVTGTTHESGIRMGESLVLRHSTVICDAPDVQPDAGCSADLTGYGDFGPVQNNTIERNLFGASTGGYCTYGGSSAGKPYSGSTNNIVFTGNVWQRGDRPGDHGEKVCGYYGPITSFDPSKPGNQWVDNVYDDGTPVASAN